MGGVPYGIYFLHKYKDKLYNTRKWFLGDYFDL